MSAMVIYGTRFIGAVSFMRLGDFLMLQKLEDILLSLQNCDKTGIIEKRLIQSTFLPFSAYVKENTNI